MSYLNALSLQSQNQSGGLNKQKIEYSFVRVFWGKELSLS